LQLQKYQCANKKFKLLKLTSRNKIHRLFVICCREYIKDLSGVQFYAQPNAGDTQIPGPSRPDDDILCSTT
jgi:hypothetical protein